MEEEVRRLIFFVRPGYSFEDYVLTENGKRQIRNLALKIAPLISSGVVSIITGTDENLYGTAHMLQDGLRLTGLSCEVSAFANLSMHCCPGGSVLQIHTWKEQAVQVIEENFSVCNVENSIYVIPVALMEPLFLHSLVRIARGGFVAPFKIPNPGEAYCFDVQKKEQFLMGQYGPGDYKIFEPIGNGNTDCTLNELKGMFRQAVFRGEVECAEALQRRAREARVYCSSVV